MYKKSFHSLFYLFTIFFILGCGNENASIDNKISKVEVLRTGDIENVLVGFKTQRIRDYNSLDILIGSLNISLINTDIKATEDVAKLTNLIEKLSDISIDFAEKSILLHVHDEPIIQSYKEELIIRNPTMLDVPTVEILFKYIENSGSSTKMRYILIYKVSNKITEVTLNMFETEKIIIPW